MAYVYELIDPRNNQPFYVGKGTGKRAESHLIEPKEKTSNLRKWYKIQSIREAGFEPIVLRVQDGLSDKDAYDLEETLIKQYGRKGIDDGGILFNICSNNRPPSMLGKTHKAETRAKQRDAHKGKKKSPEHCQNIGLAKSGENNPNWGKKLPQERIDKIRKGNLGKKRSPEVRKNMRKAHIGKSKTGNVDWEKVNKIRMLSQEGKTRREICNLFPELTYHTIADIVSYRTWVS